MRPGQNKRSRGRNGGGGGGGGGNNLHHNPNRPRLPHRVQTFDSNGPSVKIRGNAYQVFERYLALAREAQSSGDRIAAESFYQHAEHYFRVMNAAGEGFQSQPRSNNPADVETGAGDAEGSEREPEHAHVQHMNAPPSQIGDEEFKRELDEVPAPSNREPDVDGDDGHLPSFLTGRPK